jgi:hypothetical protein
MTDEDRIAAKAVFFAFAILVLISWALFLIFRNIVLNEKRSFINTVANLTWRRRSEKKRATLAEKAWDCESAEKWNEDFGKKSEIPELHREISNKDLAWVDDEGFCVFYACEGRTFIKNNYEGWHVLTAEEAEKVNKPHQFEGVRLATDAEIRELTFEFIQLRADCINAAGRPFPSPISSLAALHASEERAEKQAAITREQIRNQRRH